MTNSSNTRIKVRTSNAKTETLGLPRPTMSVKNWLIIGVVVAAAAVIAAIGFTNALIPTVGITNMFTSNHCIQTPVKMFDQSSVPKYFIGSGYKVTPMDPKVTDVAIQICK